MYFPQKRFKELENKLFRFMDQFGYTSPHELVNELLSKELTKDDIERLACHYTVGETYFYRNSEYFKIMDDLIKVKSKSNSADARKTLRIWSAGCSSGEEPYSIAIHLLSTLKELKNWKISILASDINSQALLKAEKGLYTYWSFRNTPEWVIKNYFEKTQNSGYLISPVVKDMVKFSHLNLADDVYPSVTNGTSALDIIFCRNVLMYFSYNGIKEVSEKFHKCLIVGGTLVTAPSETFHYLINDFVPVCSGEIVCYKKDPDLSRKKVKKGLNYKQSYEPVIENILNVRSNSITLAKESKLKATRKKTNTKASGTINYNDDNGQIDNVSYSKALKFYNTGNYYESEELLQNMKRVPKNHGAFLLLARVYANQGKLANAKVCCSIAIKLDKLDASQYYLFASILIEGGNETMAVSQLKKAIFINPNFVMSHFMLAELYINMGNIKMGVKHFKNAIKILNNYNMNEIIEESEGIAAGSLSEIIKQNMDNYKNVNNSNVS
jgi:chemotaxis protein methyltransferase CheR